MKIYIAPKKRAFLPWRCKLKYPPNNTNRNFTVEQDFYRFIRQSEHVTGNYAEADWVFIPVYWQRHCYNNGFYVGEVGLEKIQQYLVDVTADTSKRYFVVSGLANGPLGTPLRREMLADAIYFNASIGDMEVGCDNIYTIPLLTSDWPVEPKTERTLLASFVGREDTHVMRTEMFRHLAGRDDVFLLDGYHDDYAGIMADSLVSLSPRGVGVTSFRFFEAMQLGVVPVLLSDHDVRPFKDRIDWDDVSFFVRDMAELDDVLRMDREVLLAMGAKARKVYYEQLNYGQWCSYVLETLQALSS